MKPKMIVSREIIGGNLYWKLKTIAIVQGSGTTVNTIFYMPNGCPVDQLPMLNEFYRNACWFWAKYKSLDDLKPVHRNFLKFA